jgi:hypothetical protein
MMCMQCLKIQPVGPLCSTPSCGGLSMAKYYCSICKFFDDERYILLLYFFPPQSFIDDISVCVFFFSFFFSFFKSSIECKIVRFIFDSIIDLLEWN